MGEGVLVATVRTSGASHNRNLFLLVKDFAYGLDGRLDGLTPAELRRAWVARHHSAFPLVALTELVQRGMVRKSYKRRECAVSRQFRVPYLPTSSGRWSCN